MSIVCIIPARKNSKRLPGKNWKLLNGKPLISYTIETAIKSNVFDEIVVTTDSQEIKDICKSYQGLTIIYRPDYLSRDDTSTEMVIDHVLSLIKEYDYICLLQPTSPFRNIEDLISLKNISSNGFYSVNHKGLCNGNIYYFKTKAYTKNNKIPYKILDKLVMDDERNIDIDTEFDFHLAELIMKDRNVKSN